MSLRSLKSLRLLRTLTSLSVMLVLVLMLMGRVEVYNKKSCRGFAAAFFIVMIFDGN